MRVTRSRPTGETRLDGSNLGGRLGGRSWRRSMPSATVLEPRLPGTTGKRKDQPPPDHLTMSLFTSGMSPLHRAGLGGLACTLKTMERQLRSGLLAEDRLPAPFVKGT